MGLPKLKNSAHVIVSFFIGFPTSLKEKVTFHRTIFDYSQANFVIIFEMCHGSISLIWVLLLFLLKLVNAFRLKVMHMYPSLKRSGQV